MRGDEPSDFDPYSPPLADLTAPADVDGPEAKKPWYAISLVEIVVVLGILGILYALLLPAVQSTKHGRLRDRRSQPAPGQAAERLP